MAHIHIELQKHTREKHGRPHKSELKKWFEVIIAVLQQDVSMKAMVPRHEPYEMTVRIVEEDEAIILNNHARGINKATNVLSFPFEAPHVEMDHYLGDIALCGPVIEHEARQSRIDIKQYWMYLFIHGCLHLLGFDHDTDDNAEVMESVEQQVMSRLACALPHKQ